jgi:hypothetical protein
MFECSVNLWEIEGFFLKSGSTCGLRRSLRSFLKISCNFFFKYFRADYYEVHGLFNYGPQTIFPKV